MQEDFLHYVWKYQKFNTNSLRTAKGEIVEILSIGLHNHDAGPDFFNAKLRIAEQLWAGNVELHIKSSDWYRHGHENDKAYDTVVLHVVWEHDTEIFRKDNSLIPTLILKPIVDIKYLQPYKKLMISKSWINCESDFGSVDDFVLDNWLERLYFERLEIKSKFIDSLLRVSHNNWEAVLFKLLAKNFGLKINGDAFLSIANSFDFSIVRKLSSDHISLEALLFGQAGLLEDSTKDNYYLELQNCYTFLKKKFSLTNSGIIPLKFFRLRPQNFPTIRLSQFANLYHQYQSLFSTLKQCSTKNEFYELLDIGTSKFWESHYTFSKESKAQNKKLTKTFIDLLLINTIIPTKFSYQKLSGGEITTNYLELIKSIGLEENSITDAFLKLKPMPKNALTSQALIQLKPQYCDKNKCLHCAVGNFLITKNK